LLSWLNHPEVIKVLKLTQLLLIIFHEPKKFDGDGFNSTLEVFPPCLKTSKFVSNLFIASLSLAMPLCEVDEESREMEGEKDEEKNSI
jgi:hypothetical protein